jgi:hypothetical protein
MAVDKNVGYKKAYKMTGTPGYAGDNATTEIVKGKSGSHRDENSRVGAAQVKLTKGSKVGPDKNLNEIGGGNFY